MIDESSEFGARAARHLREDRVVWLTTVGPAGNPLPSPVWFVWEEPDTVRVFSLAGTARSRNLEANPRVSLNFAGTPDGGDIVVFSGRATVNRDAPPAHAIPAYVEKYGWGFERIGVTPEQFSQRYSLPLLIRLTSLRGH